MQLGSSRADYRLRRAVVRAGRCIGPCHLQGRQPCATDMGSKQVVCRVAVYDVAQCLAGCFVCNAAASLQHLDLVYLCSFAFTDVLQSLWTFTDVQLGTQIDIRDDVVSAMIMLSRHCRTQRKRRGQKLLFWHPILQRAPLSRCVEVHPISQSAFSIKAVFWKMVYTRRWLT